MARRAILSLNPEFLLGLIELSDQQVKLVALNYDFRSNSLQLLIEDERFPDVPTGQEYPIAGGFVYQVMTETNHPADPDHTYRRLFVNIEQGLEQLREQGKW